MDMRDWYCLPMNFPKAAIAMSRVPLLRALWRRLRFLLRG